MKRRNTTNARHTGPVEVITATLTKPAHPHKRRNRTNTARAYACRLDAMGVDLYAPIAAANIYCDSLHRSNTTQCVAHFDNLVAVCRVLYIHPRAAIAAARMINRAIDEHDIMPDVAPILAQAIINY